MTQDGEIGRRGHSTGIRWRLQNLPALPTFAYCFLSVNNQWRRYVDICSYRTVIAKTNLVETVGLLTTCQKCDFELMLHRVLLWFCRVVYLPSLTRQRTTILTTIDRPVSWCSSNPWVVFSVECVWGKKDNIEANQ